MADLAEPLPIPPDTSIADQQAAHDLDAKLQRGAERNRQIREAKGNASQTVRDVVESRVFAWRDQLQAAASAPSERVVRLMPEEGDAPAIPDLFRRGMVPARFECVTFDSYAPKTRAQQAALDAAKFWAARAIAGEACMLALIGPQGTGKSHLLYAAANVLLDAGVRLYARPWYRLADELRYGGEHPVTRTTIDAPEVRTTLWRQKIVMLDEVRPTASTNFDDMELTKFACHAYDSRYPMFVTSNVNPLADVMGKPAASRFTQIIIDGPDQRQA